MSNINGCMNIDLVNLSLEGMRAGGHFDTPLPLGFWGIKNVLFYRLSKASAQLFFH